MAGLSPHFLDRQEVGQAKQGLASQQCLQLYPFLHKVLQLQHIVGVGVGHTAVPLDVCLGLLVGQAQRRALQHRTAHLVPLSRVKGRQHPPAALTGDLVGKAAMSKCSGQYDAANWLLSAEVSKPGMLS
ncbi:hypothetical protein WJX77_006597 [Trebouxia sp. C0004]